jgi:hypothetical protein
MVYTGNTRDHVIYAFILAGALIVGGLLGAAGTAIYRCCTAPARAPPPNLNQQQPPRRPTGFESFKDFAAEVGHVAYGLFEAAGTGIRGFFKGRSPN